MISETWKRWVVGPLDHAAPSPMLAADLAVVVIGFRAQPGLVAAVSSLIDQDCSSEIVVVNSGGGGAMGLLHAYKGRIRIIDIEQPLRVGAARNIGIDATEAPYVAFLAGDCVAQPGWVSARLHRHTKGARAVASAIAVPNADNTPALAAHLLLFGLRSPQIHPAYALRYGASYKRDVFAEFGYFNTAARIAEDSAFAQRLGRDVFAAWAPEVQTAHANSQSVWSLTRDLYARGFRAARRHAPEKARPSLLGRLRSLATTVTQRNSSAQQIARDIIGLDQRSLARIRPLLTLGSWAYCVGVAHGTWQLERAQKLAAKAPLRPTRHQLSWLETAAAIDGENIALRLLCADAYLSLGDAKSREHLTIAMGLSSFHPVHADRMMTWLDERGLTTHANEFEHRLSYCLPTPRPDLGVPPKP